MFAETMREARNSPYAFVLAALTLCAGGARAQESGFATAVDRAQARRFDALEVAIAVGSAQGYGSAVAGGPSLANPGVGLDLGLGWRIDPRWMVGVYGTASLYPGAAGNTSSTTGISAGVQANYHFSARAGPWIGLGTGWHGYWLSQNDGRIGYQGLDLVRLQAGFDVPVTPTFSLEPVLGLTLTTFLSQKPPSAVAYADVNSKGVSAFVLAGALARFDLFGHAAPPPELLARN